jgi:hypothetical protein
MTASHTSLSISFKFLSQNSVSLQLYGGVRLPESTFHNQTLNAVSEEIPLHKATVPQAHCVRPLCAWQQYHNKKVKAKENYVSRPWRPIGL